MISRGKYLLIICLIAIALILPCGTTLGQTALAATPQTFIDGAGLYGLLPVEYPTGGSKVDGFLQHPQFAGVSLRVNWRTLEPTDNQYDWSYIDGIIEKAGSYNKKVLIRVVDGHNTPDWVYDAGAEAFWYYDKETGKDERIPVPWDPVYHEKLHDFIADLGARYNNNPTVVLVHVSGPGKKAEMSLPNSDADKQHWLAIGYTPEKLINAWKDVLTYYNEAFPDKLWAINVQVPIWNDGVVQTVAKHAATTYPWQCCLQINYWTDSNSSTYAPTKALLANVDEFTHGGLQPLGIFPNSGGDINAAIQEAISWHTVLYNEPYYENRDELSALYNEIQRHKQMVSSATFDAADGQDRKSQLTWTDPSGYEGFQKVRILRKSNGYPAGANDPKADFVYEGTDTFYLDTGLKNCAKYYYSMYELPSQYTIGQDIAVSKCVKGR